MLTLCSTKMTSEHLLSANFNNPRICFCAAKREKISPAKLTAFTVYQNSCFNINTWIHWLFLFTRFMFYVFEYCSICIVKFYVIAKYFTLWATTLHSFRINHNSNNSITSLFYFPSFLFFTLLLCVGGSKIQGVREQVKRKRRRTERGRYSQRNYGEVKSWHAVRTQTSESWFIILSYLCE